MSKRNCGTSGVSITARPDTQKCLSSRGLCIQYIKENCGKILDEKNADTNLTTSECHSIAFLDLYSSLEQPFDNFFCNFTEVMALSLAPVRRVNAIKARLRYSISVLTGIMLMTCLICSMAGTSCCRFPVAIRVSLSDRLKYSASEY